MSANPLHNGIKQETWDKIIGVLRSHPAVEEVILFGSRAKGNFKDGSDIDICIKGTSLSDRDIIVLANELDELNLPWEIDLLRYEEISDQAVIEHIDRVGIVL